MQNLLPDTRYSINFIGKDKDKLLDMLSIIGSDKTARFHNGRWSVLGGTLSSIIEVVDKSLLDIKEEIELGTELQSGYKLYPFQKDIVEFCIARNGSLIAAACGTGKTIIMIDSFLELKRQGKISSDGKCLVVAKSTLKTQWQHEIGRFTGLKANIIETYKSCVGPILTKIETIRKKIAPLLDDPLNNAVQLKELYEKLEENKKAAGFLFMSQFSPEYDFFIVNYETLRDEEVSKALKKAGLECVIADEVHMVKTDTAARSKALYEFNTVKYRFGATATPIKKNPLDAYGIAKFIEPTLFRSKSEFSARYLKFSGYGRVTGSRNEQELNEKLSKIMLVKTKEEIASDLPSVVPITRYCSLEPKQEIMTEKLLKEIQDLKEEERRIFAKYRGNPPSGDPDLAQVQANIMARQTFAAEIADSEELLKESESKLAKSYITKSKSNKVELLLDILEEIIESGEKAVIFSKYRKLQPILEREIRNRFKGIEIAFVNGEMAASDRFTEVHEKFKTNEACKVLLMSDAGAEGVSISWCKYLIEMEPADSYLIQTQRRGRIERADSIHDTVYVYQLIAEKSYDEIALKIINKKERYDAQIIKGSIE